MIGFIILSARVLELTMEISHKNILSGVECKNLEWEHQITVVTEHD